MHLYKKRVSRQKDSAMRRRSQIVGAGASPASTLRAEAELRVKSLRQADSQCFDSSAALQARAGHGQFCANSRNQFAKNEARFVVRC